MEEAVDQFGAADLDEVGQLEAPLEGAARDAAVEELTLRVFLDKSAIEVFLTVPRRVAKKT